MSTEQYHNIADEDRHVGRVYDSKKVHDIASVFVRSLVYVDRSHVEWTLQHKGGIVRLRVSTDAAIALATLLTEAARGVDQYKIAAKVELERYRANHVDDAYTSTAADAWQEFARDWAETGYTKAIPEIIP